MICRPTGSPFARHLAGLDLGDHALVTTDRDRKIAHTHALQDTRMADPSTDLQVSWAGVRSASSTPDIHLN